MRRFTLIILSLFLLLTNSPAIAAEKYVKEEIKSISPDGFNIVATLEYPKTKGQKEYKTVLLLHSLGYNSQWWGNLPEDIKQNGYAILKIDLRGHGNSIYTKKLTKVSWKNLTYKAYSKYPDDVLSVMKKIKEDHPKKEFFKEWAVVGCDIGANTSIIVADKYPVKPKTIVMISPSIKTKGLFVPINIAQIDGVDYLAIINKSNFASKADSKYLKKFAQNEYSELEVDSNSTGMVMLRGDDGLCLTISKWLTQYLETDKQ